MAGVKVGAWTAEDMGGGRWRVTSPWKGKVHEVPHALSAEEAVRAVGLNVAPEDW